MSLLQAARARLERSKKALGTLRAQEAEDIIDAVERTANSVRAELQKIDVDPLLSPEGKRERTKKLFEDVKPRVDENATRFAALVEARERSERAKLELPSLKGDDVQGRLQNARTDAVMVLDRASNERLGETMETLARDPGDVGYLLLSGFGERYLQARPDNRAAAFWDSKREALLVERLGEEARVARDNLAGLADARAAAVILKHEAHAVPTWFGPPFES